MDSDSRETAIHLKDYTPPHFNLHETRLEFFLDKTRTQVVAELEIELLEREDLILDGKDLRLLSIEVDGNELAFGDISVDDEHLTISVDALPERRFTLRTVVEIDPSSNTSLDGLYLSNGMYCTQCEAQGFRKITYYPDRPDVMTTFRVKIHSDLPVRLSNGNKISGAKGVTEWHDPWPKPCYLFALVAGDLEVVKDKFKTVSGRKVDLQIYVRKGDETRCDYAMDALKRSMRWDEEAYGREYDLDLFMIVAVDDFNMGAMENKGLNIFNSKLVLASPDSATDADYAAIESVIAHEYFHNWTGNRITCRDWFQLSLKEGLTVFRDQQFSAHERSAAVQRIDDVRALRARQFPEDASPLAHPVRPEKYHEINNFYTATIYEKGAELIGMLHGLVGAEAYRKALDLYFERHDGQACTIEDWLKVFEDTTGRDLAQFKLWYKQAGTPSVTVATENEGGTIKLTLNQELRMIGENKPKPMLIPLAYSILDKGGNVHKTGMIELTEAEEEITLSAPEGAQISLGQGFSAPIHLSQTPYDAAFFARFDNDPFNRFEAMQRLALDCLVHSKPSTTYANIIGEVLDDESLEPDFKAQLLTLPNFSAVLDAHIRAEIEPDPSKIEKKINLLRAKIAEKQVDRFKAIYKEFTDIESQDISPEAAGRRSLSLSCLKYLSAIESTCRTARAHFKNATLMTDKIGAMSILTHYEQGDTVIKAFYKDYKDERLLIDKWFAIQVANAPAKTALTKVQELTAHEAFASANPNRWRALMGGFAISNPAAFHAKDGKGYAFYADKLIEQDAKNPQIAARMSVAFQNCNAFDAERRALAKGEMMRILQSPNLSKNLREMISRMAN